MAPLFCQFFLYNPLGIRCFDWVLLHKPEHDLSKHCDERHEDGGSRETRDVSRSIGGRPKEDTID